MVNTPCGLFLSFWKGHLFFFTHPSLISRESLRDMRSSRCRLLQPLPRPSITRGTITADRVEVHDQLLYFIIRVKPDDTFFGYAMPRLSLVQI